MGTKRDGRPWFNELGQFCLLKRAATLFIVLQASIALSIAQDAPDPLADQAKALLQQAGTLSQTGTLTVVDSKGLRIDGTNLIGAGVERPDSLVDRAAELYADDADQKGDLLLMRKAVGAWKRIPDYLSPVGFLKRTADKYRKTNTELATYCDVELARCYIGQGDSVSGLNILAGYLSASPDSEQVGKAQIVYARELLWQGRFDEAAKIAQAVKAKLHNESMTYDSDDAYAISLGVLAAIPSTSQTAVLTADEKAKQQQQQAEANPRLYYELGNASLAAGDHNMTIVYWQEYRKRLPNDEQSRLLANKIAEQYVAIGDTQKALDAYKDSWTSYPNFKEGWQARIAASMLQEKAGQLTDALDALADGFDQTTSAEGKASVLARQADLYIKNHQPDEAVEKYIILLSQFGDQNAARNAYKGLTKEAALVADWHKATNEIRDWLIGKDTGSTPAQYGSTSLNLVGRSELRRLALSFFIQQNDATGAGNWLQSIGYVSDPIVSVTPGTA